MYIHIYIYIYNYIYIYTSPYVSSAFHLNGLSIPNCAGLGAPITVFSKICGFTNNRSCAATILI